MMAIHESTKTNPLVKQQKRVLYADDDLDDKAWVTEACKALNFSFEIDFVENGRQALEYLNKLSVEEMPALIVLDLNMPEMDGRQTLQKIKTDTFFKDIPVIIVTTSSNKGDIEICRRFGANLYLIKPDTHLEWRQIVQQFLPYVS